MGGSQAILKVQKMPKVYFYSQPPYHLYVLDTSLDNYHSCGSPFMWLKMSHIAFATAATSPTLLRIAVP